MIFYPVTLRRFEPDSSTATPHHAVAAFLPGSDRAFLNRTQSSSPDAAVRAAAKADAAFKEGKFTPEGSANWAALPLSIVPTPALAA